MSIPEISLPNNEQIQCIVMGGFSTAVRTVTGQWYSFGRNDMAQLGLARVWFGTQHHFLFDVTFPTSAKFQHSDPC